jgi:hypothetical protein
MSSAKFRLGVRLLMQSHTLLPRIGLKSGDVIIGANGKIHRMIGGAMYCPLPTVTRKEAGCDN